MEKCYEALLVKIAAKRTSTMKALQTIAGRLNPSEQSQVMAWATAQAEAIRPAIKAKLQGSKYLQVKLPGSDVLSVFDLQIYEF
ncbi:MAG TPA: hypothetical protein DD379_03015 [Cyanobacteria bacterium UBA11162]|nr:hypothetical protein [Cyanobacteria bacterium UBA11162]